MSAVTKKPLQIYLRQEQLDALRALAKKRQLSMAELVRQAVDRLLDETPIQDDPLWSIVGIGNSELGDLAADHDRYLD
jgi:acetylglutamate synthase